jgi:hypothetical protein
MQLGDMISHNISLPKRGRDLKKNLEGMLATLAEEHKDKIKRFYLSRKSKA